jgi:hypothetical protein
MKYTKFEKSVLALGECTYKFEKVCLLWLSMFITENNVLALGECVYKIENSVLALGECVYSAEFV